MLIYTNPLNPIAPTSHSIFLPYIKSISSSLFLPLSYTRYLHLIELQPIMDVLDFISLKHTPNTICNIGNKLKVTRRVLHH